MLINGDTSGFDSYDGVSFFNTAHVSGDSGGQSNKLTESATDTSDPTTDEFKAALKGAMAGMMAFKDDQADPMAITATGLACVVPTNMYLTALEAVNATLVSNTSNVLQGAAGIISFPWPPTRASGFCSGASSIALVALASISRLKTRLSVAHQ